MEGVESPEPQLPLPRNILINSVQALDQGSLPASRNASREASVAARVAENLKIDSTPDDDEDEEDFDTSEDELLRVAPQRPSLPYSDLPTGVCYDSRMRFHTELDPPKDRADYHPEDPRRIFWIFRTLCEAGLVSKQDSELAVEPIVPLPVCMLRSRIATRREVCLVHDEAHFEFLKSTATQEDDYLTAIEKHYDSIYFNQSTFNAALLSAGSAVDTCLAVAESAIVKNAIAIIRPPGHHAVSDQSMGFCHFDNVAVAANVVREKVPDIRKILVVDWDVHHGNGIQQAFEADPNVLYISIHVHQDGNFYPSGPYGDHLHCGIDAGIGKNINIPWPTKGMGDADYLFAFQHIVMPVAFDFNPDFVIIAAGFDAAAGDQLGGCFVTPACYAHMTYMLKSLAGGKIVACLEGGYNLEAIALSALAVTKTLMGEPPPKIQETAATRLGIETVRKVIAHQSRYWRCLYPKDISHEFDSIPGSEKMHDVVRNYQSHQLYTNHNMIRLWVFREKISRSFEDQVLATPTYANEKPLLLIFHDPPEVIGQPDIRSGTLELHRISMSDVLKHYISWAIENGLNVIDVNIPKFLTGICDHDGIEEVETQKVITATEELASYIWENYVECNDSKRVIFFGVGEAFNAILHILNTRTWDNIGQYAGVVGFSRNTAIKPVSETSITGFANTYRQTSLIFTARNHPFWSIERKKLSRKFGHLFRSTETSLNAMLWEHKAEAEAFILQMAGVRTGAEEPPPGLGLVKVPKVENDGDTVMVASGTRA